MKDEATRLAATRSLRSGARVISFGPLVPFFIKPVASVANWFLEVLRFNTEMQDTFQQPCTTIIQNLRGLRKISPLSPVFGGEGLGVRGLVKPVS